ncbi:MAG: hypothetical protein RR751_03720 [Clostridia bacterium]
MQNNTQNIIDKLYYLIVNFSIVAASVYMYFFDIRKSPEFVFLRISKRKWLREKYVSSIILNAVFHSIMFFAYICIKFVVGISQKEVVKIVILAFLIRQLLIGISIFSISLKEVYGVVCISVIIILGMFSFPNNIFSYICVSQYNNLNVGIAVVTLLNILVYGCNQIRLKYAK